MLFIDGNQNDLASSGTKRASNISIIESEGSYTPRHKYNTRLSAKLSNTCELERNTEINSSAPYVSSSSLVSQQQVERIDQGDILDNPLCYKPTSLYDNKDSFLKTIKRNLRMDWSERCPRSSSSGDECSKLCVIGVIAVAIAVVLIPAHHVLHSIRKDLVKIKDEVDDVKGGVAVDLKETHKKLSSIEKMLIEIKKHHSNQTDEPPDACQKFKKFIKAELERIEREREGRPDFALASAGGKILRLINTENLETPTRGLFGSPDCDGLHGPVAMIQRGTDPGECWAFKGNKGTAILRLLGPVIIDAVSIEHIAKAKSPSGNVNSAPKDFIVKGLSDCDSQTGLTLGRFSYDVNGPLLQTFEIPKSSVSFEFVEFSVLNNHGNPDFTCVYRFKVHGTLEDSSP